MIVYRWTWLITLLLLALASSTVRAATPVWVRVTLLAPASVKWRVHIIAAPGGRAPALYVGDIADIDLAKVTALETGQSTPWFDMSSRITGVSSVRFLFAPLTGVQARFDIATANNDQAIVRSITEADNGGVIALRIPADLVKDKQWLLSIREDAKRRYDEVKAMNFPAGPLPKKIWCMTGFRSNGEFYTDPDIAQRDFDTIKLLGMNGYWEQNGGQPGVTRQLAAERGINYSTIYQRDVAAPPGFQAADGLKMNWTALDAFLDDVYKGPFPGAKETPDGLPTVVTDLSDEPDGTRFGGPEYQQEFCAYLRQKGFTPDLFGKKSWDEISAYNFNWYNYFKERTTVDMNDLHARRLFYWATRFVNDSTARLFAMATKKVEQKDVNHRVIGTRVNFGPPWMYDYGSLPRGIDAFEFGKERSVSIGFNEDWVGGGDRRTPLESNTLLTDWSRAALRPQHPLIGSYITRDANRATVKLRVFGCLARECKIFDFYYYGPAYTFFDHWSDNLSMVQGVGEVLHDMGQVDDILWDGKAPKAEVALLYSKSWPVWKQDDTEQNEQMMVYIALLHAGIPVDIVSNEEVADGRFAAGKYKCLYVVNESIPVAAAQAIAQWVKKGGRLWMSGWAGMRDEYNTPTAVWNDMLGITERSWKPVGNLARLGEIIEPADYHRPLFAREVTGAFRQPAQYGKGQVMVAPRTVGKDYMDSAKEKKGALVRAVIFPEGAIRDDITRLALAAKVTSPAVTTKNEVLAWPLWTKTQGVVLLSNFTGDPVDSLTVRFIAPLKVKSLRSLKEGPLKTKRHGKYLECTLPMKDVTDILVVNQ